MRRLPPRRGDLLVALIGVLTLLTGYTRGMVGKGRPQVAPTRDAITERGVTLVELIISMLIISIALAGVLSVMNFTTSHSADPMIQHQAVAIAEAYMEEILLQEYANPTDGYTGSDRSQFDDVDDYNSLPDTVVRDQDGVGIPALSGYGVTVTVEGPPTIALNGIDAKKITVSVSHPAMGSIELVGYRTRTDY